MIGRIRRRGDTRGRRRREGFTLIEVVTVAVVMGTLVRISIPNLHELLVMARAAEVVGHFETVRVAVLNYQAEHLSWPEDSYVGQIPDDLREFLPAGYSFEHPGYRLDWENWALPSGLPDQPTTRGLLGISINTEDAELGQAVMKLLGPNRARYRLGGNYTFVIERM